MCVLQGHFPDAKMDPVIQIASMVTVHGDKSPVVKNIMTLDTCDAIAGAEVRQYRSVLVSLQQHCA